MSDPTIKTHKPIKAITLTQWRELMGYSRSEAARAIGCSLLAWNGWEDGRRKVPPYIGYALAARANDMSPYGTLSDDDQPEQEK